MSDGACAVAALGDDAALVTVTGSIGALEAADLSSALEQAGSPPVRRIVVDLTAAEVIDPEAVSVLYETARVLRARDGLLAVAAADASTIRRVLYATGLRTAFQTYPTRRAALDDLDLDDPAAGS